MIREKPQHQQLQQLQQSQEENNQLQQQLCQVRQESREENQQLQDENYQLKQQLQKSHHKLRQTHQESKEVNQQLHSENHQLKQQLQKSQQKLHQVCQESKETNQKLHDENHQLQQQLHKSQHKLRQVCQANQQLHDENHQLRQQLQQSQQEICQLQQQLDQSPLQEDFRQLHIQQDHWVVTKGEITMTQEVLGKGGWGEVRVAKFRGLRVAAKCLHDLILSDYNIHLFTREMEMAARIRHPNLLQFIGATREGSPIILSELMPTSLHKELEKASLPRTHILCISVGVAAALNYLHLWRPSPIIHRDVSSPNVLLEPSADGSWKAKLSDYGSANLVQRISPRSVAPGSPVYSAPEAQVPVHHSPAMDVYSYGVLLTEMVLRRLPGSTVKERQQLALSIKWSSFKDVVTRCIATDRQSRPSIADVLQQLEQMKA